MMVTLSMGGALATAPSTVRRGALSFRRGRVPPRRALAVCGLKENLQKLSPASSVARVEIPERGHSIVAGPGKMASVQIYKAVSDRFGGTLDAAGAAWALEQYGEYVEDARQNPGSHPNIDLLFAVQDEGLALRVECLDAEGAIVTE